MEKILTIGILQWGRLNWLDKCLSSIPYNESIEIIVVDDGIRNISPIGGNTEQETKDIINKFPNVIYRRRLDSEPFGINEQIIRLSNLSKGKFLWVLGNDDVLLDNSLPILLEYLQDDNEFIYVNYKFHKSIVPPENPNIFPFEGVGSNCEKIFKSQLSDFMFFDPNFFTPTYCSVMKTCHWKNAYKDYKNASKKWIDLDETIPYVIYILNNLLYSSSVYIGTPLLLCSYLVTWDKEPNANNWQNIFNELKQ